jgi:hypothetical protein
VSPWCYKQLQHRPPSPETGSLLPIFREQYRQSLLWHQQQTAVWELVTQICDTISIPATPLKGLSLIRTLYRDAPHCRVLGDLDLLVPDMAAASRLGAALEKEGFSLGYISKHSSYEMTYRRERHIIDIHYNLFGPRQMILYGLNDHPIQKEFRETGKIIWKPENEIFYLFCHCFLGGCDSIKNLVDIIMYIRLSGEKEALNTLFFNSLNYNMLWFSGIFNYIYNSLFINDLVPNWRIKSHSLFKIPQFMQNNAYLWNLPAVLRKPGNGIKAIMG